MSILPISRFSRSANETAASLLARQRTSTEEARQKTKIELITIAAYEAFQATLRAYPHVAEPFEIEFQLTNLKADEHILCAEVLLLNLFNNLKTTDHLPFYSCNIIFQGLIQHPCIKGLLQTETFQKNFLNFVINTALNPSIKNAITTKRALAILETFISNFNPISLSAVHNELTRLLTIKDRADECYMIVLEIFLLNVPFNSLQGFIEPLVNSSLLLQSPCPLKIQNLSKKNQVILQILLQRNVISKEFMQQHLQINNFDFEIQFLPEIGLYTRSLTESTMYRI